MAEQPTIAKPRRARGTGKPKEARPDARAAMLDAAEALFGERGIAGVSLREIGAFAGQRNNSAVSYHFQDKAGLVHALLEDRVEKAERIRNARVAKTPDLAALSATELLRLLWQPLLEVNGDGRHSFVRFFLNYQLNPNQNYPSHAAPERFPVSMQVFQALRGKFPHLSDEEFSYRLALLAMMTWAATAWHDNTDGDPKARRKRNFSLENPIKLAVGALLVPA